MFIINFENIIKIKVFNIREIFFIPQYFSIIRKFHDVYTTNITVFTCIVNLRSYKITVIRRCFNNTFPSENITENIFPSTDINIIS